MTPSKISYPDLVKRLAKPGAAIALTLTPEQASLWHMATGISGEAGEFLDAVKKFAIYQSPINRENAIEELGDIEFYMEGARQILGISREMVIEHNIKKLQTRYPAAAYSDQAAQDRKDKE